MLVADADTRTAVGLLEDIADRLDRPRPVLELLGTELEEYEDEVFATHGHGAWPSLDPATQRAKGSGRILVASGDLLASLTGRAQVDGEGVELTGPSYLSYLRSGTSRMPKRDPAPEPPPAQVDDWAEVVLGYVATGRRR